MENDFGKYLRALRVERRMSQEELAKLLGTTKQVISHYETGQRSPKITVVSQYAKILGISLEELCGETPEPKKSPLASVLEQLLTLDQEDLKVVIQVATRLQNQKAPV